MPSENMFAKLNSKCMEEALQLRKKQVRDPSHYENFMAFPFFKDPVYASTPLPNLISPSPNLEPEKNRFKNKPK